METHEFSIEAIISETIKNTTQKNDAVYRKGDAIGGAVMDFAGAACVLSSRPFSGFKRDLGRFAIHTLCNEMAASGAQPVAISLRLLVPPGLGEGDVRHVFEQVNETCSLLGVEIVSVEGEFSDDVHCMLLNCTATGKCWKTDLLSPADAKAGDTLILTKNIGLQGSMVIANDHTTKAFPAIGNEGVESLSAMGDEVSAVADGICAAKAGAHAICHVSAGGVLAALYRLCSVSGCGADIYEGDIQMLSETRKLCSHFVLDPLRLSSSGCMLIATDRPDHILETLKRENVIANVIGELVDKEKGIFITGTDDIRRSILAPRADEIYRLRAIS